MRDTADEYAYLITTDGMKNLTLKQAMASPEWPDYEKAMQKELDSLEKTGTWENSALPKGRKPIGYVWTFTKKVYEKPVRYKARLCAQGFSQVHGFDYFNTYSPVIRQTSLRILFALAAANNMDVHKVDIETAFLHGDIAAEIYMKAPAQLGLPANSVVRLRKAIYGLKQASLIFHNKMHDVLATHGFTRCSKESCLYVIGDGSDKIIIGVYVEDLMISSANPTRMQWIKDVIADVFATSI
jgi:hypothetical protein